MQIDLHTHQPETEPNSIRIYNLILRDSDPHAYPESFFSVGIHPWYIPKEIDAVFLQLDRLASLPECLAIGECGIDRKGTQTLKIQEDIFRRHIDIAISRDKPLVIHAVKSYGDLIRIKKEYKRLTPWILHGFSGNEIQLRELIRNDFYFSISMPGLRGSVPAETLIKIPLERLFLETDDGKSRLSEVYEKVSQLLGSTEDKLVKQIHLNFNQIFQ
jgi:TatD DNase family protein